MAYWCKVNYREGYAIHASNGILFNHESPRRGETFVSRKITRTMAEIANGSKKELLFGDLDAVRSCGYAKEYVESMWLILKQDKPSDYVGASVKGIAESPFARVGLNWQDQIEIDQKYFCSTEVDALIADPSKANKDLRWKPKNHSKELAEVMVDADLNNSRSAIKK